MILFMLGDTVAHTMELRLAPKSYTAACLEFPEWKLSNLATIFIVGPTVTKCLNVSNFSPEKPCFWVMMINYPGLGGYQEIIVKIEYNILRAGFGSRLIIDTLAYTRINLYVTTQVWTYNNHTYSCRHIPTTCACNRVIYSHYYVHCCILKNFWKTSR